MKIKMSEKEKAFLHSQLLSKNSIKEIIPDFIRKYPDYEKYDTTRLYQAIQGLKIGIIKSEQHREQISGVVKGFTWKEAQKIRHAKILADNTYQIEQAIKKTIKTLKNKGDLGAKEIKDLRIAAGIGIDKIDLLTGKKALENKGELSELSIEDAIKRAGSLEITIKQQILQLKTSKTPINTPIKQGETC